jgi:hemerythrin-like domain-containing protein
LAVLSWLIDNGMPKDKSQVAAMLMKYDEGRYYVRAMDAAVHKVQAGGKDTYQAIADNALGYAALLRDHIAKEDDILYPLSERVLQEALRAGILERYQAAEERVPSEFSEHYASIVKQYEQE